MAAAAWTRKAIDITPNRELWDDYLNAAQLADLIGLSEPTIMDTLTRRTQPDDPRNAIAQPAARIGQTRLAAAPMWTAAQAEEYLRLKAERDEADTPRPRLPVVSLAEAAEKRLASIDELADMTGRAENSHRRWARQAADYPPEVAQAERVPPWQYGPPRVLRSIPAVIDWMLANTRMTIEDAERLTQLRDEPGEAEREAARLARDDNADATTAAAS